MKKIFPRDSSEGKIFLCSLVTILELIALSGCVGMNKRSLGDLVTLPVNTAEISKSQGVTPSVEIPAIKEPIREPSPSDTGSLKESHPGEMESPLGEAEYRIGEEDELEISVYGDSDLAKTQTVRPGGKIAFPLIGDVQASGLTPDELRTQIEERLAKYVKNPRATVIITKYSSKKVSMLGEVRTPGLLRLSSDINLLEGISRAGGVTEDADLLGALLIRDRHILPVNFDKLLRQGDVSHNVPLKPNDVVLIPNIKDKKVFVLGEVNRPVVVPLKPDVTLVESISRAGGVTQDADLLGALLIRDRHILPVNFDKLLRQGDVSHNVPLKPNDVVLIPNIKDKKVFVLGEVNKPLVVTLKPGVTLVESISLAGGFTRDAQSRNVLIVRGGLGDPTLVTIDVDAITKKGNIAQNVPLQPGDIVYVPKTLIASVTKFFDDLKIILTPLVLAETGIVLGPALRSVLTTGKTTETQPIVIGR